MMDLKERLRHFKFTGGGRDDGKTKGEYSAIFFDSTRLHLLESKTFWLPLTPDTPGSKSWDAAITRIVTWARFRDNKTKKIPVRHGRNNLSSPAGKLISQNHLLLDQKPFGRPSAVSYHIDEVHARGEFAV